MCIYPDEENPGLFFRELGSSIVILQDTLDPYLELNIQFFSSINQLSRLYSWLSFNHPSNMSILSPRRHWRSLVAYLEPQFHLRVPFEAGLYDPRWSNKGNSPFPMADQGLVAGMILFANISQIWIPSPRRGAHGLLLTTGHIGKSKLLLNLSITS